MDLTEEQQKGQEVFFRIISEAWENDNFKKRLIENPDQTLEFFFGKKPPISKKIKVTDQSDPECLYINIPVKPQNVKTSISNKTEKFDEDNQNRKMMTGYKRIYDSLKEIKK